MADIVKKLGSGAELIIKPCSFKEGHALFKAVAREIETVQIGTDKANVMKSVILKLVSSLLVEDLLWPCMSRCLYRGSKVLPESFEDMENRKDFLVVAQEVLMYNLGPFIGDLESKLHALLNSGSESTSFQK